MWGLLISTIFTSAADSLNPFAITQQFVLQGIVKKPRHIWYFILPTGITNFIGGFFAYYGFIALLGSFLGQIIEEYGRILYTAELLLGVALIALAGFLFYKNKAGALEKRVSSLRAADASNENDSDEAKAKNKIKSISPLSLVILGVGATISELATALPYFAFLAILINYHLAFWQVTLILLVYNTIYTSPLIILYFIYIKTQDKFDRMYRVMKAKVNKWSNILGPALAGVIGAVLVCHSISLLLK
ncbi:MAG: GAP family protein [Christensenellales bacterium]|jgi:cytochrome c biogenesis protein CcdA